MQLDLTKPRLGPPEAALVFVTAFWLGMITTLFLAIPTIFGGLPDDRAMAGRIAAKVFSKADAVRVTLAVVAVVAGAAAWRRRRSRVGIMLVALPVLAAISVAIGVGYVAPAIIRAQAEGTTQTPAFRTLHGVGTGLFVFEGVLALGMLVAIAARVPPHRPPAET